MPKEGKWTVQTATFIHQNPDGTWNERIETYQDDVSARVDALRFIRSEEDSAAVLMRGAVWSRGDTLDRYRAHVIQRTPR